MASNDSKNDPQNDDDVRCSFDQFLQTISSILSTACKASIVIIKLL